MPSYLGRFAPSPTGPLHAGSLVAALASYLDALVHGGQWLLRIDDADLSRSRAGARECIIEQLTHYGFAWYGAVTQTQEFRTLHVQAFERLSAAGRVYGCGCTRAQLSQRGAPSSGEEPVYLGHCRYLNMGLNDAQCRAARLRVDKALMRLTDRWAGDQSQDLSTQVGDFIVWRPHSVVGVAGGLYSYQLTMPCDDAAQGITHVVRGADLLTSTARQLYVHDCLSLTRPQYLHVPVVTMAQGLKLSKQNHAPALPNTNPLPELDKALIHLGCRPSGANSLPDFWRKASAAWEQRLSQLELLRR
jgi:glutamyl-Q tRNA(Asp) synthetase